MRLIRYLGIGLASPAILLALAPQTGLRAPAPKVFAGELQWARQNQHWNAGTDISPAFTPDGKTVVFTHADGKRRTIMESHLLGEEWSRPVPTSFSGRWRDIEPAMAPDGSYLIFISNRPTRPGGKVLDGFFGGAVRPGQGGNLWRVDRQASGGWGQPKRLPDIVNDNSSIFSPTVDGSGNLYFAHPDPVTHHTRLYFARRQGSSFAAPAPVQFADGTLISYDPAIAADGSFLVFASPRPPTPSQLSGIFVAYPSGKGWSAPIPLSPFQTGIECRLSPDQRTLYFTTEESKRIQQMPLALPPRPAN